MNAVTGGASRQPDEAAASVRLRAAILYLCADPQRLRAQLAGHPATRAEAGALRDDISTDEITPLPVLVHFDARLERYPYTGLKAGNAFPIVRDAVRAAGFEVAVAGKRYGKGSSREHSVVAERAAGIRLVIAESFERIYRQNADNIGLFTATDFSPIPRIEILQPACGACANCGPGASTATDQVTISAINRNFPGRSGPGQVWLASPLTVAASAIAGDILSFAELQARVAAPSPR